jgi:oligopeptide/dipeptide ABC transporter ATP-binding protein
MYLGKIVEIASAGIFGNQAQHPYTEALLASAPVADPARKFKAPPLEGDVASPLNPPLGCRFHPRCPEMQDICKSEEPPLREISPGQVCACHFR